MKRSITIHVHNRTDVPLTFEFIESTEGPDAVVADRASRTVAPGQAIKVVAENRAMFYAGNEGTFRMNGPEGLSFTIFYTHPQTHKDTSVYLKESTGGGVAGTDRDVYSGDPAEATIRLYRGVAVPASGTRPGHAVPLFVDAYRHEGNCQDFVNGLYGKDMRQSSLIVGAGDQTVVPFVPADFSGQLNAQVIPQLMATWHRAIDGITEGSAGDGPLLAFLAEYLAPRAFDDTAQLTLWIPELSPVGKIDGKPLYKLTGYRPAPPFRVGGKWNDAAMQCFLGIFLSGAHIVAISADADLAELPVTLPKGRELDLDRAFHNSGLPNHWDIGHSHYRHLMPVNPNGSYYLDIKEDFAPAGCGLILALLFGKTVLEVAGKSGSYNSFMQLEGWPAVIDILGSPRHGRDYKAHIDSVWNISTFGASPYSEKRGTTVFLAPQGWRPQIYQTTRMAPYVGAYAEGGKMPAPQPWLETELVTIPPGTPELPDRYFVK